MHTSDALADLMTLCFKNKPDANSERRLGLAWSFAVLTDRIQGLIAKETGSKPVFAAGSCHVEGSIGELASDFWVLKKFALANRMILQMRDTKLHCSAVASFVDVTFRCTDHRAALCFNIEGLLTFKTLFDTSHFLLSFVVGTHEETFSGKFTLFQKTWMEFMCNLE
jgi:hypothetical protein